MELEGALYLGQGTRSNPYVERVDGARDSDNPLPGYVSHPLFPTACQHPAPELVRCPERIQSESGIHQI